MQEHRWEYYLLEEFMVKGFQKLAQKSNLWMVQISSLKLTCIPLNINFQVLKFFFERQYMLSERKSTEKKEPGGGGRGRIKD